MFLSRTVSFLIIILGTVEISPRCVAKIDVASGRNYPSGGLPTAAVVADFNNDGVSDIASANINGPQSISVFLNNGDGTFQASQTIYSDYGPVEVADFDLDGRLDIAFLPQLVERAPVVFRGQGDASFGAVDEFPTGQALANFSFVLSDLTGDAKPEAIVQAGIDKDLTALLNTARPSK